jgi:hypothetical protein
MLGASVGTAQSVLAPYALDPPIPPGRPISTYYGTPPSALRLASPPTETFAPAAEAGGWRPDWMNQVLHEYFADPSKKRPDCWVSADYLLWWVQKSPMPTPLVTSGAVDVANPGALGSVGTNVLVGGSSTDFDAFSGGRVTAGAWLDDHQVFGLEAGGFLLQRRSIRAGFSSDQAGRPLLGIPFLDANTGNEDFAEFTTPGQLVGRVDVSSSLSLGGGEVDLLVNLFRGSSLTLDVLGGFRYLDLREDLRIGGSSAPLPGFVVFFGGGSFAAPAVTSTFDRFHTGNQFYGGQLGTRIEYRSDRAFVQVAGKLALGETSQSVDVSGRSTLSAGPTNPVATLPGGLFAQPGNIGRFTDNAFTAIPEVEVKVGYQFTSHVRATVGYNFLYWSNVVRPGNQLNRSVDPGQVPTFGDFGAPGIGTLIPTGVSTSSFWAQGVSLGLEIGF